MKNIKYLKIDFHSVFLYSLFLLPLIGSGVPAYIIAIIFIGYRITTLKFKLQDVFFLIAILVWFVFKCQQSDIYATTILLRYYFGFYIFYLFFNNVDKDIDLNQLLLIFCIVVLAEAVLVNTIINPEWLPNYPKSDMGELVFETKILGFYQRPYSIGTNSTITSTLIMVLLFNNYSTDKRLTSNGSKGTLILAIITVIILGSGTGYMLFLLFLIYKIGPFRNSLYAMISCLVIFILYYLIFIADVGSIGGLEKISSTYLDFLYDFKIEQIDAVKRDLLTNYNQLYIGKKFDEASQLIIWSDFAWNDLFLCAGFIGLGITSLIFLFKTNKYNWIPVLIFVVGAIHYGAMYSLPGQLLLGYFFSSQFRRKVTGQIDRFVLQPVLRVN